jgi:hypothetical protein
MLRISYRIKIVKLSSLSLIFAFFTSKFSKVEILALRTAPFC